MPAQKVNESVLRSRLKLKHLQTEAIFLNHHPHAAVVLKKHNLKPGKLRLHASKLASSSAVTLAGIFLPGSGAIPSGSQMPAAQIAQIQPMSLQSNRDNLKRQIENLLPKQSRELTPDQESKISEVIKENLGISAYAQLEGNRLNDSYGYIGAEQHLPRFPGDTVSQHDEYQKSGITPGRGAWGYFAATKSQLTPDLIQKEKYYFAVQTLYLPDWETRLPYLRQWYKYRKMIAINPNNGKSLVGVVADSGPAWWTGKQFGGSPEVMGYLDLKDGKQRSKIVLFFVDDPQDKIPLGPIEYNINQTPLVING